MASFGNNEFSKLGRYRLSDNQKFIGGNFAPFIPAISGTGAGTTSATPGNGYTYQTYTASGTLLVSQPITADILVVGGGGAGGGNPSPYRGGGGGAGGVVYFPNFNLSAGTYTISIGGGAGAASSITGNPSFILNGDGSTFAVAVGGGCGRSNPLTEPAQPGGSGGGGGPAPGIGTALQPTTVQGSPPATFIQYGNPGGYDISASTGGGGGAGAVGGTPNPTVPYTTGGAGGTGVQFPAFSGPLIGVPTLAPHSGYYGGGGGGFGGFNPTASQGSPGPGGAGGGGKGAALSNPTTGFGGAASESGAANTGGGGGATNPGTFTPPPSPFGTFAGGSGIVIVRYQVSP